MKVHAIGKPRHVDLTRVEQAEYAAVDYDPVAHCLTVRVDRVQRGERVELAVDVASGALTVTDEERGAAVRRLLAAFRLDSRVKWQIDHDLPKLLAGELSLAQYPLTGNQREALQVTIAQG